MLRTQSHCSEMPMSRKSASAHIATICSANVQWPTAAFLPKDPNKPPIKRNKGIRGRGCTGSTLSGRQTRVSQPERKYGSTQKNWRTRFHRRVPSIKSPAHCLCSTHNLPDDNSQQCDLRLPGTSRRQLKPFPAMRPFESVPN